MFLHFLIFNLWKLDIVNWGSVWLDLLLKVAISPFWTVFQGVLLRIKFWSTVASILTLGISQIRASWKKNYLREPKYVNVLTMGKKLNEFL